MNYKDFNALFNSRLKRRDYKVYNNYHALCKDENDNILVIGTSWVNPYADSGGKEGQKGKYERVLMRGNVYATISPDSVLTLMQTVNNQGIYNLFNKLIACGRVYCDRNTGARIAKYRVRHDPRHNASVTKWDVPAVKGVQINLATGTLVTAPPDLRKVTDRKVAAPVYKRVDEVIKLMMVLRRMGDLSDQNNGFTNYHSLRDVDKSLADDNMVNLAEAAYRKALYFTTDDRRGYDHTPATLALLPHRTAAYEKRLLTNARRYLTQVLKEEHGGYVLAPRAPATGTN